MRMAGMYKNYTYKYMHKVGSAPERLRSRFLTAPAGSDLVSKWSKTNTTTCITYTHPLKRLNHE